MVRCPRFRVLLLSRAPRERLGVLQSFRRDGARVQVASSAARTIELLAFRPELVIVDLAYGAALSTQVVETLNRASRSTLVVALHDGNLENTGENAHDLSVAGYCRADDLAGNLRLAAGAAF